MPTCPKCNHLNSDGAPSCSACGGALAAAPEQPGSRSLVGRVVNGKYEVLSLLGEGGMGMVYKVRHLLLQNKNLFALKVLRPHFSDDKEFRARFLREVELTMELTHENIVQIRDFGMTEEGQLFFTMDYFPGKSLKSIITEGGPLSPSRVIEITVEILLALGEAHKAGIIHRDLKPDNVLVEEAPAGGQRVRVLDFGIAKLLEGEVETNTLTHGNLIGTPKYMSPEQASGEAVDCRSDLYSLGVILYELLVGRVPFPSGTARSILMSHLTVPPPPFRLVRPDIEIPASLENLVFDLLAKDPGDRPDSAEVVLPLLKADTTVRRVERRRRRLLPVGRLAFVGFLGLAGILALEHYRPWRWFFVPEVEAEGASKERPRGGAEGASAGSAAETAEPFRRSAATRLRCEVCGAEYKAGEKVGGMCHGLPLLEVRE